MHTRSFKPQTLLWIVSLILLASCATQPKNQPMTSTRARAAYGTHGMVASVNPMATEAGLNVLKSGGNAVDAAVAVALTLGVVDGDNSGIGGGCFLLIRRADGTVVAIDGREKAPAAATRNMFVHGGKADTTLSQTGALASGVPGALAAYDYAVKNFGKMNLKDLIAPAERIATDGFQVDAHYAAKLRLARGAMEQFPSSRATFFKADGSAYVEGDIFKQPDLAATYHNVGEKGVDWFYKGPFGTAVETWMKQNWGIMTARDFAQYRIELREPIRSSYRGYELISFPPPSSGGVHVTEILNILEHFDLPRMDDATRCHATAEAMKLAFADRAYWLGDPDYAAVPHGLVDKAYAAELARKIDLNRVSQVASHGMPPDWQTNVFKKHTTHFSVADAEGNWVSCTATINTGFGSKVVIPGTGVVMNNQMDDFSIEPGTKNYFGLIGGEANAVAAGKRPLSSMSPTIVLKKNQPILALGAAGGPTIISQVVVSLENMLDLGESPDEAIAQPRFHHQWSPDELTVEAAMPENVRLELAQKGHKLVVKETMGATQIVGRMPDGRFIGVADPRVPGRADGW